MYDFTRRDVIKKGGAALGLAAAGPALLDAAHAWAANMPIKPEAGAEIRILRWKRFVESEGAMFEALVDAFSKATGVKVRIDNEGFEDIRPKAAVAASLGQGPDIIWTIHADPHLYPDSLHDMKDVADYLGGKYGGWYDICEYCSKRQEKWVSIPYFFSGNFLNYRVSHVKNVGFDGVPDNTDDFLRLMQEMNKAGTPGGFALGNASGDGNAWTHWILWSHGGKVVDDDDNPVLDSPEVVAALEYVAKLGPTFLPGCASWLDGNNNKAMLQGSCSLTNNGISIYAAARRDPNMQDLADDIDHAYYPTGPGGQAEFHVQFPMMLYKHSQYPDACKSLITWLMEKEQYDKHLDAAVGYLSHPLRAYNNNPVWTDDPKRRVFKDTVPRTRMYNYSGSLGYNASAVFADFVVVNMVAEAALGTKTPAQAAKDAQRRAARYYRG